MVCLEQVVQRLSQVTPVTLQLAQKQDSTHGRGRAAQRVEVQVQWRSSECGDTQVASHVPGGPPFLGLLVAAAFV